MNQIVFVMMNWWQGSSNDWGLERRLPSTLFKITSLILGVQSCNFGTVWVPVVVTFGINFSWMSPLLQKLVCFLCVLGGSWKESMSTLFVITPLILDIQSWNFDSMWAPIVVISYMNFSMLLSILWELSPFLCVFENMQNLLIDGHNGPAGVQ